LQIEERMKDEVEDFLRRVAQMRAQAEAQARAQQQRLVPPSSPAQPPQVAGPQPPAARMNPPARLVPARTPPQEVVYLEPVEVVDAELADLSDSVGQHVAQHLRGPQQISEHARHLGAEVDQADDKLKSHLHQTFDHQLGKLKTTASSTAATPHASVAPDVTMTGLLKMLRSSEGIRDAVVMAEILRRPEW
jgi:hypothetical protein